jgi:hypothetical protein
VKGAPGLSPADQRALSLVTDAILGKHVFDIVALNDDFATLKVRSQTSWQESATANWYQTTIDRQTGEGDCTCPHVEKTGTRRCKHTRGGELWLIYTGRWPDPRVRPEAADPFEGVNQYQGGALP